MTPAHTAARHLRHLLPHATITTAHDTVTVQYTARPGTPHATWEHHARLCGIPTHGRDPRDHDIKARVRHGWINPATGHTPANTVTYHPGAGAWLPNRDALTHAVPVRLVAHGWTTATTA